MRVSILRSIRMNFMYKLIISIFISAMIAVAITIAILSIIFIIGGERFARWLNIGTINHEISTVLFDISFILLPILIFIILLFSIFYFLTKNTIDSIKNISKMVQEISDGNFGAVIPVICNDEIGILSRNINNMSTKLKQLSEKDKKNELAKKDLINNISHDLRTPLTSIIGYLDIISQNKCQENEKTKYMEIAYNKALRLNVLVNQLFEFSKIDSAIITMNKVNINIVELVEQVTIGFIQSFNDNNLEYTIHSMNRNIEVCVDPDLIVRVFENLLANAVKYGACGGKIELNIQLDSSNVRIMVSDYGEQIPIEESEKIFDKLYRLEKSNFHEGTGLGLSIARSIVELHSGELNLELNENKKTFTVILPLG